jgi:mRNA interferase YafQ
MKYSVQEKHSFVKDVKTMMRRGKDLKKLRTVVKELANDSPLPTKNRDHALTGEYVGYRECHIEPDWLLVYQIHESELILLLVHTGTHSDLF